MPTQSAAASISGIHQLRETQESGAFQVWHRCHPVRSRCIRLLMLAEMTGKEKTPAHGRGFVAVMLAG